MSAISDFNSSNAFRFAFIWKKHENDLHEFAFGTLAMCAIDALEIFTMGMATAMSELHIK